MLGWGFPHAPVNVTVGPVDTTPPTVTFLTPTTGQTVSGVVSVTATATDNVGVASVEFFANGVSLGLAVGTTPATLSWPTTFNGLYVLTARATDLAGNVGTATPVTVTVFQIVADTTPPVVALTAPADLSTVHGTVSITATATDNVAVAGVTFRINGVALSTDTSSPYSASWVTTTNGSYTLDAIAVDTAGNSTTSAARTVTVTQVDTTPPVVTITAPTDGATVSGRVTLTATATDNVAVTAVTFTVNGVIVGVDTTSPYSVVWQTGANGQAVVIVTAVDAVGNVGTSAAVTVTVDNGPPPDTTPPTVAIAAPLQGATVQGTVQIVVDAADNVAVASVAVFAGTQALALLTAPPYVVNWITGANGTVQLRAVATDTSNNTASAITTVSVQQPVIDTTPPTVMWTSPLTGDTVAGTVTLMANAFDAVGVTQVVFSIGATVIGTVTSAPYQVQWATGTNGPVTLTASASDAAGNVGTASIQVTVAQIVVDHIPPVVALIAPADGATVSGTVTVSATATDNVAVASVQFYANGALIGTSTFPPSPYGISWATGVNGSYVLTAVATDTAGNQTTSASRTVTVLQPDVTPPLVSLTAPANGATVSGVVPITATATDASGVVSVTFKVNGSAIGTVTTLPYGINWVPTTNGSYTLQATAVDPSGNVGTSATRTVTVTGVVIPDTTPPIVTWVSPANGATVQTSITLSVTASDNVGVVGVQFLVNGVTLGTEVSASPYQRFWDITGLAFTNYTLSARARDAAGNTATASRTVTLAPLVIPTGLLGPSNLTYLGAFRIPTSGSGDANSANFGANALVVDPNTGTLLVSGMDSFQKVAEISIPTPINSSNINALNVASLVRPFSDVLSGHGNDVLVPGENASCYIGGLAVSGGRLIVDVYVYFDTEGATHPTSHFVAHRDLSGYVSGPYQIGTPARAGYMAGCMTPVPAAFQGVFGGPWLTGQNSLPIIGRTSTGPSATVFDPAHVGVITPVPATMLVGYDNAVHPTLGKWESSGNLWNGSSPATGFCFPSLARSVLWFGIYASGTFCYGEATANPALAGTIDPNTGEHYCYDPMLEGGKGPTAFPYAFHVWAYDANDLAAVTAGTKQPWQVVPYTTWSFTLPILAPPGLASYYSTGGVAYDAATQRIYLAQKFADTFGQSIIHVFQVS